MKKIIFLAALVLTACSKPHVLTLMEHCTALQRQSEADEKRYTADPSSFTAADKARYDAGFQDYFANCRDSSGHGIAPSAR
jgi:hypothetical protein